MSRKIDLTSHLPRGEWANVQIVAAPGMMAKHEWAVLARARWLREGGRQAFIKFIVKADSSAGTATDLHTSATRLEHLRDRLLEIKRKGSSLPVVPILTVELDDEGLLVAMEEVQTLQSLIEAGDAREHASRVLRDLDPAVPTIPWFHFDLCGRNTGCLDSGRVVLIDLESLYLEERGSYEVTVPAWKQFRAPARLVLEVQAALAAGTRIPRTVAETKTTFEVILTAAECVLGPLRPRGKTLERAAVEAWVAPFKGTDALAELLGHTILDFIEKGTLPRPAALAHDVDRLLSADERTNAAVIVTDSSHLAAAVRTQNPDPPPAALPPQSPADALRGIEWQMLAPTGNALRAGRLDWDGIRDYGNALGRAIQLDASNRDAWDELVLVLVAYEKDAVRALDVLNRAVKQFPSDPDLQRMRTIVHNWAMDKKQ